MRPGATRAAERARRSIGTDIERLRLDAGITRRALGNSAGVNDSFLHRVEAGISPASVDIYARLAIALGADLSIRLYPNTGPTIRDRHQAGILESLLAAAHPRWARFTEVAVRRPSRGWIDLLLHDPARNEVVAVEIQSELRRLEQLVRWSEEKAAALPSWEGWGRLGTPTTSKLLLIRRTRTTRSVADEHWRQLALAYPADPRDALDAIRGDAPWPGPAILWAVDGKTLPEPRQIVAIP
ncbi:MAG: helix-turn-helix transcriptional regulator [Candidatus Limnocylindrales bacterium]